MVGLKLNNKIHIVYDSHLEDEESLDKFKFIMSKAGFKLEDLVTIDVNDLLVMLEKGEIPSHTICINKTYRSINVEYSDLLDVPIYDFFSKEYCNDEKQITLFGLLLDIKTMHEPAYKKYAWSVVNKFYTEYSKFSAPKDIPSQDKEEVVVEEVETVTLEPHKTEVEEEILEVIPESVTVEAAPETTAQQELSYEDLLRFYNTFQSLITQLQLPTGSSKNV